MEDEKEISNPRMQEFDGVYANDAYSGSKDPVTLRDHFAGLAMQACISVMKVDPNHYGYISDYAYRMADAMLEQRKK